MAYLNWSAFHDAVYDEERCVLIKADGIKITIQLTSLMLELRNDGRLAKLPLSKDAFMIVEEFDGHYFWPVPESCRVNGRILPL
jgi:hypothetical protein